MQQSNGKSPKQKDALPTHTVTWFMWQAPEHYWRLRLVGLSASILHWNAFSVLELLLEFAKIWYRQGIDWNSNCLCDTQKTIPQHLNANHPPTNSINDLRRYRRAPKRFSIETDFLQLCTFCKLHIYVIQRSTSLNTLILLGWPQNEFLGEQVLWYKRKDEKHLIQYWKPHELTVVMPNFTQNRGLKEL